MRRLAARERGPVLVVNNRRAPRAARPAHVEPVHGHLVNAVVQLDDQRAAGTSKLPPRAAHRLEHEPTPLPALELIILAALRARAHQQGVYDRMRAGMRRPRHQPLRPGPARERRVVEAPRAHGVRPVAVLEEKKLEPAQLALPVVVQLHRTRGELEHFLLRGAVQSLRAGADQAHVPEAPTALAERLAAAARRIEARLEQGVHALDLIHEVSELGGELREGVTHDGLVVRLAGGDHVELLLDVRSHSRERKLGIYAVVPLNQRDP